MNNIKVAFLDIGGVILSDGWNYKARTEAVQKFGLDALKLEKDHAVAFPLFENGKLSLDEYLNAVIFTEERSFALAQFRDFVMSKSTLLPDFLNWLLKWKQTKNIRVFAVNNEGKELNDYRIDQFNLCNLFDAFVSSCEVGLSKPDPSIFKLALGIAHIKPENVIYLDDRAIHVSIAKQLGINAFVHKNLEESKSILDSINLS